MLVSHEVPLSLLEKSKKFNDYDYCLLHLTYKYPEYKQFYINSVKEGRQVLLDNSLFELGDSLSNDKLAQGVLDIKPTWYVVPDCLNNKDVTIDRFDKFIKEYKDLPGLKIGVVQGSTLPEIIDCYKYMSEKADKIAIPFDSEGFECFFPSINIDEERCYGRQAFVYDLIRKNIWNKNKPHHLLGCALAKEFMNLYYPLYIETIDTSNPIITGVLELKYKDDGVSHKPSLKVNDIMEHVPTSEQEKIIRHNLYKFRKMIGGGHEAMDSVLQPNGD